MPTDWSKNFKTFDVTLPYALLRSWTSLTIGQEIIHSAKDYKDQGFGIQANRVSKHAVNVKFTRNADDTLSNKAESLDFHLRSCNVISHSKNFSERVGDAINLIMEDTALMNKVMKSLLHAKKMSKFEVKDGVQVKQDDEEDECISDDGEVKMEEEEDENKHPLSNLTEAPLGSFLSESPKSMDVISQAIADNEDSMKPEMTAFSCWECGKSFLYHSKFIKHLKSEHDIDHSKYQEKTSKKRPQVCPVCSQAFTYSGAFKKHLRDKHDMSPPEEIPVHGEFSVTEQPVVGRRPRGRPRKKPAPKPTTMRTVINTATALMKDDTGSIFEPVTAPKPANSANMEGKSVNVPLSVHVLKKFDDVFVSVDRSQIQTIIGQQLCCQQCSIDFETCQKFAIHMIKEHLVVIRDETDKKTFEQAAFYCHLCTRSVSSKLSLEHHFKYKHRKHYTLLESQNPTIGEYSCEECMKSFVHFLTYRKHMSKVHDEFIADPDLDGDPESEMHKHSYCCTACPGSFTRKEYLVQHINEWHPEPKKLISKILGSKVETLSTRPARTRRTEEVKEELMVPEFLEETAESPEPKPQSKPSVLNKLAACLNKKPRHHGSEEEDDDDDDDDPDDELSNIAAAAQAALTEQLGTGDDDEDEEDSDSVDGYDDDRGNEDEASASINMPGTLTDSNLLTQIQSLGGNGNSANDSTNQSMQVIEIKPSSTSVNQDGNITFDIQIEQQPSTSNVSVNTGHSAYLGNNSQYQIVNILPTSGSNVINQPQTSQSLKYVRAGNVAARMPAPLKPAQHTARLAQIRPQSNMPRMTSGASQQQIIYLPSSAVRHVSSATVSPSPYTTLSNTSASQYATAGQSSSVVNTIQSSGLLNQPVSAAATPQVIYMTGEDGSLQPVTVSMQPDNEEHSSPQNKRLKLN